MKACHIFRVPSASDAVLRALRVSLFVEKGEATLAVVQDKLMPLLGEPTDPVLVGDEATEAELDIHVDENSDEAQHPAIIVACSYRAREPEATIVAPLGEVEDLLTSLSRASDLTARFVNAKMSVGGALLRRLRRPAEATIKGAKYRLGGAMYQREEGNGPGISKLWWETPEGDNGAEDSEQATVYLNYFEFEEEAGQEFHPWDQERDYCIRALRELQHDVG